VTSDKTLSLKVVTSYGMRKLSCHLSLKNNYSAYGDGLDKQARELSLFPRASQRTLPNPHEAFQPFANRRCSSR